MIFIFHDNQRILFRYDRNKHIFPASRWEPWDPTRNYGQVEEVNKFKLAQLSKNNDGMEEEGSGKNILTMLARGAGNHSVKSQCNCTRDTVCDMHFSAGRWGGVGGGGGWD